MKYIILLLSLLAVSRSLPVDEPPSRHTREVTCQPPYNLSLIFQSLNQHLNASTYLQLGSVSPQDLHLTTELNTDQVNDSQNPADRTCPSSVSDEPGVPVRSRSLCPWWYNVTQLPEGHFPALIPQAECKCDSCVHATLHQCTNVTTNIRVLRETGCQDGFRTYEPVLMKHYVGCTCVRRSVAQDDGCGDWGCFR